MLKKFGKNRYIAMTLWRARRAGKPERARPGDAERHKARNRRRNPQDFFDNRNPVYFRALTDLLPMCIKNLSPSDDPTSSIFSTSF